ncbi:MAG: adenylyl-sulfate kinase, partial [Rubrivivax sp.]|nr:adenylyl-sulfate kinase [Rubrivivax sp.]
MATSDTAADPVAGSDGTAPVGAGLLRFITCGSVDDGKSTLIGRLLFETGALADDQLAAVTADSQRWGTQGSEPDYALLL